MKRRSYHLGDSRGKRRRKTNLLAAFPYAFLGVVFLWLFLGLDFLLSANIGTTRSRAVEIRRQKVGDLLSDGEITNGKQLGRRRVRSATIDLVVERLLQMARMPKEPLRMALNTSDPRGGDPFHLSSLERGSCPWTGDSDVIVDWLPLIPKPDLLAVFREGKGFRPVVLWYEHLSKAGGTSFCKLAEANMPKISVPSYYCMPGGADRGGGGKGNEADGRVGTWSKEELTKYVSRKPHKILSNEWDPFPPHVLDFQPKSRVDLRKGVYDGPKTSSSPIAEPMFLFITSIRNPLDRLLSAYRFFGVLHNPSKQKPSLFQWLGRIHGRAQKYSEMRSRGNVWDGVPFRANVGNFNFAIWKFSNGTIPFSLTPEEKGEIELRDISSLPLGEEDWRRPFEKAIETLSNFHMVIPMEMLSDHTGVLHHLGWTQFDQDHVVPSGKVQNNAAMSQLTQNEYDALWSANWLDMIIYCWSRAVFLTRIHCADILLTEDRS
mmetsp:Transcript_55253/g.165576  ORF Transcript_55253/g.165576 Transcript_55253/m.165576 type:complete len:490 (-) Transcript_55253:2986-4455(-)